MSDEWRSETRAIRAGRAYNDSSLAPVLWPSTTYFNRSVAENLAFAESERFPYRLLSDADRIVGAAYGAQRGPDEQFPDFPKRVTFLIDPEGRIAKTYVVTDVAAHPEEVLADLRAVRG